MIKRFTELFLFLLFPISLCAQDIENDNYRDALVSFRAGRIDDAIVSVNNAISDLPDEAKLYLFKAELYVNKNSIDSALQVLDNVIEAKRFGTLPLMYKTNLLILAKQYDNALVSLNMILESEPKNLDALIAKARIESAKRLYSSAEKTIADVIKLEPDSAVGYYEQGNIRYAAKNKKEALESYRRAVDMDKENPVYILQLGISYRDLKKYKEANKCFNLLLEKNPLNEQIYFELAKSYALQGKREETLKYVKAAVLLEERMKSYFTSSADFSFLKNDPEFLQLTAKTHALSIPGDTLRYYITNTFSVSILENSLNVIPAAYFVNARIDPAYKSIVNDPSVPADRKMFFMGMAMRVFPVDTAYLAKSVRFLSEAIRLNPFNPEYYYQKAVSLYLLNKKNECLSNLDIAVYIDDHFISARFLRSFVNYLSPQKGDSVFQDFKIVNQYDPANMEALNNYGTFYIWKHNNTEMAREYLKEAVRYDPAMALAYYNLYNLELIAGNFVKAESYVIQAGEYNETFRDLLLGKPYQPFYMAQRNISVQYLILGRYMQDIRRYSAAEYCFKKSFTIDPKNALAHYYLGRLFCLQNKIDTAVNEAEFALRLNPYLKEPCRADLSWKALQYNAKFKELISK